MGAATAPPGRAVQCRRWVTAGQRRSVRRRPRPQDASAARCTWGGRRSSSGRAIRTPSSPSWARRPGSTRIASRDAVRGPCSGAARPPARRDRDPARRRVPAQPCSSAGHPETEIRCRRRRRRVSPTSTASSSSSGRASSRPSGSFATALLSGRALGITRVHGQEQEVTLGGRTVTCTRSTTRRPPCTRRRCSTCSSATSPGCRQLLAGGESSVCSTRHRLLHAAPGVDGDPSPARRARGRQPVQLGLF